MATLTEAVNAFYEHLTADGETPEECLEHAGRAVEQVALQGVRSGASLALSALETRTRMDVSKTHAGFVGGRFPTGDEEQAVRRRFRRHADALVAAMDPRPIINRVLLGH